MKEIFIAFLLLVANLSSAKIEKIDSDIAHSHHFHEEVKNTTLNIDPNDPCKIKSQPTEEEIKMATIAWKYFENNIQEKTGLINSVHNYSSASIWDWANAVYGMFSAKKLGIISQEKFETLLHQFLRTMQEMDIFNNELPNKTYSTKHAKMTNYKNKKVEDGTGWSVADIARLLASLNVVYQCEYTMRPAVEKLMIRYRYCRILSTYGDMFGASYKENKLSIHKETMTGYEEYLARGMALWGHDTNEARRYKFVKEVPIYGVKIPTDTRTFYSNFVGSESYWNTAFDYGVDDNESARYIQNIYKVQEARYRETGQITAVTEDNIDKKPYFLYNSIYTNGEAWKIINHDAQDYQELKSVSTKAGLSMKPLFGTEYSTKVFEYLKNNYNPKKGYYAGIYESTAGNNKAITLNTNSVILESLLYSNMGALQELVPIKNRGTYDHYRNKINNFKCLPTQEEFSILEPFDGDISKEFNSTERNQSKIAWRYFKNNYNPETGFVNGSNKHKILSVADIATGIKASLWARELDIISTKIFQERTDKVLSTLKKLKLFNEELPSRYYDAQTAKRISSSGEESKEGNGFKLYDIAQLVTALYHLQEIHPEYQKKVFNIVSKYDFSRAIQGEDMYNFEYYGVDDKGRNKEYLKRIKDPAEEYYIYAALRLFNFKSYSHFLGEKNLHYEPMYHYEVPMSYEYQVANAETYLWAMMELPHYLKYKHYSSNIYLSLKDRYEITGKYATSSMEKLDKKPHTIFNDIYNNKRAWSDFDKKNTNRSKANIVSVKSAFIYDALYGYTDNYSQILLNKVKDLYRPEKGWYAGLYSHKLTRNHSLNSLTNMAILASYYYKKVGNFYYHNRLKLKDKIALHHIKEENIYTLESIDDPFFYKIQDRLKDFDDNSSDIMRIVRKGENFVMHYGVYTSLNEAENYLQAHLSEFSDFNVTRLDLIDDKDFLLSNRYYNYNYKLPYENKMIDEENTDFKVYYTAYQEAFIKAKKLNAKERAIQKEKEYRAKKEKLKKGKKKVKKK